MFGTIFINRIVRRWLSERFWGTDEPEIWQELISGMVALLLMTLALAAILTPVWLISVAR